MISPGALWRRPLPVCAFISFSICPLSKADHWLGGFYWRYFQFLELGRGVISDSAAPGKSLSASLCWVRLRRSISLWRDHLLLSREHFSAWLLGTAPNSSLPSLFIFIFFGAFRIGAALAYGRILIESFEKKHRCLSASCPCRRHSSS